MIDLENTMPSPSEHTNSWFMDETWCRLTTEQEPWIGPFGAVMCNASIKGLRALITPPWALHTEWSSEKNADLRMALENENKPLVVIDLPLNHSCNWKAPWIVQESHTRMITWDAGVPASAHDQWPKHRLKQLRKGSAKGIVIEGCTDVDEMMALHQMARERKSLPSDAHALRRLLQHIIQSPHQSSLIARDSEGNSIANAVILHNKSRSIYAFGGQKRSALSALATVMLLHRAIEISAEIGQTSFDFGGSRDSGVDRFYAEFGALKVKKYRAILCRPLHKWWLRILRPDLFR